MIAWITRSVWLAIACVFAVLVVRFDLPLVRALLVTLAIFLSIKFAITTVNFVIAALANRRDPVGFKLHPMRLLYGFMEEQWATTMSLFWTLPWAVLKTLPTPLTPLPHRLPVLMIHGYVCNRGYWIPAAQKLIAKGYVTDSITLEPAFGSIDTYTALIHAQVSALKAQTGAQKVVLVCHSMGGLAARAYLRDYGEGAIAHVITVGTPHDGTVIAQLGLGENTRQMERKSKWRKALALDEPATRYTLFTTIYSRIDNIVAPARTGVLPGAKEIELIDVGHVAMSSSPRCLAVIFDEIERVSRG
jgi:triacylglycerol esterase/lipase EstA (alpha/beta hydrolase family)